ncbi:MAG: hypothetical protein GY801_18915, partial [bacterium]|nr:hypothetical protein [bacterium]
MKLLKSCLLLLSVLVFMLSVFGLLTPSFLRGEDEGNQCGTDAEGNPNLLTLYAPGHSSSPVPEEEEEDPGAFLPVSAESADPGVMSLLRLEVCKPQEMEAVTLTLEEGGDKIRLFHPVPGRPLKTNSLSSPSNAVWIQAIGPVEGVGICAEGDPYTTC